MREYRIRKETINGTIKTTYWPQYKDSGSTEFQCFLEYGEVYYIPRFDTEEEARIFIARHRQSHDQLVEVEYLDA